MMKNFIVLPALFCLFLAGLSGCTAPLVFQGVSSGAPVAFNSTGPGRGDSTWLARYDDVVQATMRAGQALSLKLEKKKSGSDQIIFHFIDDKGNKLQILIERRTETMTYARLNVGWFGSTSMGRLMARQIVSEMIEANAFLRNWHPEDIE
jgi:hypothetical protein